MEKFVYYAPTEIVFGKDEELRTAELVKKYGGSRVFVVYGGNSAVKNGLIQRILSNLESGGIEATSSGGVVPNPLVSTARKMISEAIAFRADFILAVGGGSVIDTAKGVAHGVAAPEFDVWDFWTGTEVQKSLPVGAVLTISAAGSETSDSAVLTNDDRTPFTKRGINTPFNRCRFAVMNPELTMTLPKRQIGAGVADIFMHTSERYFSPVLGNHLTDEIAEGLFRDIITYGPAGVKNPKDYEAMSEIMWCGSISHIGITGLGAKGNTPREGDWACHQLGMALSALLNSTHGETLTAVWGSWARYVCRKNPARFSQFAKKVWGTNETDEMRSAMIGIEKTEAFFRDLAMPLSLTELIGRRPTDEEIEAFAFECSYGKKRKIGNFMLLDHADMIQIYQAAQ